HAGNVHDAAAGPPALHTRPRRTVHVFIRCGPQRHSKSAQTRTPVRAARHDRRQRSDLGTRPVHDLRAVAGEDAAPESHCGASVTLPRSDHSVRLSWSAVRRSGRHPRDTRGYRAVAPESRASRACGPFAGTGTTHGGDSRPHGEVRCMSDQTDRWIDSALEDLAAVDVRAVVRPEVKAAVLRAWNAQQAAWGGGGAERTPPRPGRGGEEARAPSPGARRAP